MEKMGIQREMRYRFAFTSRSRGPLGLVVAGRQGDHRQQQDDHSVFAPKGREFHRDLRFKHRDNRTKNQLFI